MKKFIITTLALLSFAGCSEENPHNFRTKDLLGSITGDYFMAVYTAKQNGQLVLDHNEGRIHIRKYGNEMSFLFYTFQSSPNSNGSKQTPLPGMLYCFDFQEEIQLKGKAYDVNFEATVPTTVIFYNQDPELMYTVFDERDRHRTELTIKAEMKEAGIVDGSIEFDCDIIIDFEVEGDQYHFHITKASPYLRY